MKCEDSGLLENYIEKYISDEYTPFSHTNAQDRDIYEYLLHQEDNDASLGERLQRGCGQLRGKRVLDIGSGVGGRALAMARIGVRVLGIEPLEYGVKASIARGGRDKSVQADFLVGRGEELPFKEGTFDSVTSFYSLELTGDIEKVISESYRVLKENGCFYCEITNNLFPYNDLYKIFWFSLLPKFLNRCYLRLFRKDPNSINHFRTDITRKRMVYRLRNYGFKDIKDTNTEYICSKINNPDTICITSRRRVMKLLKIMGLAKIFSYAAINVGLAPTIQLCARKGAGSDA